MSNRIKVFAYWHLSCQHFLFDQLNPLLQLPILFFHGGGLAPVSSCLRVISLAACSLLNTSISWTRPYTEWLGSKFFFDIDQTFCMWTRLTGCDRLWYNYVFYNKKYGVDILGVDMLGSWYFGSWHFESWHFGKNPMWLYLFKFTNLENA